MNACVCVGPGRQDSCVAPGMFSQGPECRLGGEIQASVDVAVVVVMHPCCPLLPLPPSCLFVMLPCGCVLMGCVLHADAPYLLCH